MVSMLRIYTDSNGTTELTVDKVKKAVPAGETLVDERRLFLKSDNTQKTYEDITITAINDTDNASRSGEIDYLYAPDNSGSPGQYVQSLQMQNGSYDTAVPFWRKVVAPKVNDSFNNTVIQHSVSFKQFDK